MRNFYTVICMCTVFLAACGGSGTPVEPREQATLAAVPDEHAGLTNPLGPEAAAQGAAIFQSNCATCHGPEGRGDGPAGQALEPPPGDLAEVQAKASDAYLFWRIHDGKPGTAMFAWRGILTDEQIWQLVSFIRMLE